MKHKIRKQLKDKSRKAYGLIDVLRWDIETIREDIDNDDMERLANSIYDVEDTLYKLTTTIDEISYIINLDKLEGP